MRFAKMPEEPPQEVKDTSDSSDEDDEDDSGTEGGDESSSGEDSESEAKRATQLSYLHKQVRRGLREWSDCSLGMSQVFHRTNTKGVQLFRLY